MRYDMLALGHRLRDAGHRRFAPPERRDRRQNWAMSARGSTTRRAEPRRLDDARARCRAHGAHRPRARRARPLASPSHGQRRRRGRAGRACARPGGGRLRDRVHRTSRYGRPRPHQVVLHGGRTSRRSGASFVGETVESEGARMRMLHPKRHAPSRPVDVPILIGALGPKGQAVANSSATAFSPWGGADFARVLLGRVPGTAPCSPTKIGRAVGRPRPGTLLMYHSGYEYGADVTGFPGGKEWLRDRADAEEDRTAVMITLRATADRPPGMPEPRDGRA